MGKSKAKQNQKKQIRQSRQHLGVKGNTYVKNTFAKILNSGMNLFLVLLIVGLSGYFRNGYMGIGDAKYSFFKCLMIISAVIMLPLVIIYSVIPSDNLSGENRNLLSTIKNAVGKWSFTDFGMLALLFLNLCSYVLSQYQQEALWGTGGWHMGLFTQVGCILIYFFVSRFYDGKLPVFRLIMCTIFVVFVWGLLNRFSVYPVDMKYYDPAFISCIGNINWFCGYWSVFFGIGVVMYWNSTVKKERILLGIYNCITLGIGVIHGSDSAFISLYVVFAVLLWNSFADMNRMKRFLELCIILCGACQLMRLITILCPEALNRYDSMVSFMLGNVILTVFVIVILIRLGIEQADRRFSQHAHGDELLMQRLSGLRKATRVAIIGLPFVIVVMMIANSLVPGIIGRFSDNPVFIFNDAWGSARGATWKDGLLIFEDMPIWGKLFGAGPDCFAMYAYSHNDIASLLDEQFGEAGLTNAHNECITLLVNIGVLGLAAFLTTFAGMVIRCMKAVKQHPEMLIFAICILSYLFHNLFSFEQILNIPYVYMLMGLAENWFRKNQTKGSR